MTRAEYNQRRRQIQAELADKTVEENLRHNRELGVISTELRTRVAELDRQFVDAGGTFSR